MSENRIHHEKEVKTVGKWHFQIWINWCFNFLMKLLFQKWRPNASNSEIPGILSLKQNYYSFVKWSKFYQNRLTYSYYFFYYVSKIFPNMKCDELQFFFVLLYEHLKSVVRWLQKRTVCSLGFETEEWMNS